MSGLDGQGFGRIISGDFGGITYFGVLALVAAVISIIVKESIYWYMRGAAKKIDSSVLMADAWHSRLDGITSIGSFIGVLGVLLGVYILDPLVSVLISALILKTALHVFKEAIDKMVDKSCEDEIVEEIREVILSQDGAESIDDLKTRVFGNRIYVEVEIGMDASVSLLEAHNVAEAVHDAIEEEIPKVKHCMVHVNPISLKE